MRRYRYIRYIVSAALTAVLLTTLAACSSGCVSWFAPKANTIAGELPDQLAEPTDDPQPFDHSAYDALLQDHVDLDAGRVDYAGLKADASRLDAYLARIAAADVSRLDDDAELALLINAYNAYTLKLIVEHYPGIASIKDLDDPWGTKRYVVAGQKVSLDDIEHGLIRPIYTDARIHFAVNCASIGCPPLADRAYTGAAIDAQLDAATRRTLQDPRYARIAGGELHLTAIMNWYRPDFVGGEFTPRAETLGAWVAPFASDEVAAFIARHDGDPPVDFLDYDWRLNDVR